MMLSYFCGDYSQMGKPGTGTSATSSPSEGQPSCGSWSPRKNTRMFILHDTTHNYIVNKNRPLLVNYSIAEQRLPETKQDVCYLLSEHAFGTRRTGVYILESVTLHVHRNTRISLMLSVYYTNYLVYWNDAERNRGRCGSTVILAHVLSPSAESFGGHRRRRSEWVAQTE